MKRRRKVNPTAHPFNIPAFSRGIDVAFRSHVTFFVGENGSGKSTILEALAECCGFNPKGGSRDHHREVFAERSALAQALRLSRRPKVTGGFSCGRISGRAGGCAFTAATAHVPQNHLRPRDTRTCAVSHRNSLADYPQLSRCSPAQPRTGTPFRRSTTARRSIF